MFRRSTLSLLITFLISTLIISACTSAPKDKVCVVLDTGGENDKGFNEFTLRGAREAAQEVGLEFAHRVSASDKDYTPYIDQFVEEECDLILTVGFLMAEATAKAARANPDVDFAIIDVEYFPGMDCEETAESCYSSEGGLDNVTSLMFAEDQAGYLAGTLAGCMTETGVIGSVSGMEIPPVVKFVVGYQNGARAINPEVETLNVYIPEFNNAYAGKREGDKQVLAGADVIFGVGGNTGNGGLLAAHDVGLMTIGVDVDQYETFPDIASSLLTSAAKNMDTAAANAVRAFASGQLDAGVLLSTVASNGVGLAPYHDWENRIPKACQDAVKTAAVGLESGEISTGYAP
jgi:basic membrane lipoprotein Med (substrate-binding protein (PBP1-ABC) superfamily)